MSCCGGKSEGGDLTVKAVAAVPLEAVQLLLGMITGATPFALLPALNAVGLILSYVATVLGNKVGTASVGGTLSIASLGTTDDEIAAAILSDLLPKDVTTESVGTNIIGGILDRLPTDQLIQWLVNFFLQWLAKQSAAK